MNRPTDSHDAVTDEWAAVLLDFWFDQVGEAGWWGHDDALDRQCLQRFARLWAEKRVLPARTFLDRADDALAAILLFDQLPRNMFRGTARAFESDPLVREIARGAIAQGYDVQIGGAGRAFFYMPFQHSEAREDQDLALTLFEALGDDRSLAFAREHRAIIARFGRFPHRNAILGRETLPEEEAAAREGKGW
jgi:uncharacterized protein (DUF924 family)